MSTKLKPAQREKVRSFTEVTNSTEAIAITCLTSADWNLEGAFEVYYQNPAFQEATAANSIDLKKVDALFNKYANDPKDKKLLDNSEARIGPNGMMRLLNDLGIDPASVNALILAWKMNAKVQCEFSLEEFRSGLREMKVDSFDKLRNQVKSCVQELEDRSKFRSLYQFTFTYAKSVTTRYLDIDTAIAYWKLLFQDKDPRVCLWVDFLKDKQQRGVSSDTWNLFFEFLITTDNMYTNYDSNGAYPVLIDDFVMYAKDKECKAC